MGEKIQRQSLAGNDLGMDPISMGSTLASAIELYEKLLKNSGQMSALDDATSDAFESALDDELHRSTSKV